MSTERVDIPQIDTVTLKHPVEVKGFQKVTSLTFRRPKAKDLKEIPVENLRMGDMIKLIAKLAETPLPVIEEMDVEDLQAASGVISGFLNAGQGTGEKA